MTNKPIHMHISPNKSRRPEGVKPSLIIIHGTVGSDQGDLSWLMNPESEVSYHDLIFRDGSIHNLVPYELKAWHAGISSWRGVPRCNDYSIGIGISNLGWRNGAPEHYTGEQYNSAGYLCAMAMREFKIPLSRIVGHYHVSPVRKEDPWYHFNWGSLFFMIDHYLKEME